MRLCRRRAAPEIISNLHIEDATKIDIWSAGVMLYVMLFCCYPFERPDDNANQGDQQKYQKARTEGLSEACDHEAKRQPSRCLLWSHELVCRFMKCVPAGWARMLKQCASACCAVACCVVRTSEPASHESGLCMHVCLQPEGGRMACVRSCCSA